MVSFSYYLINSFMWSSKAYAQNSLNMHIQFMWNWENDNEDMALW